MANLNSLEEIGVRLRNERRRLNLSQSDMGAAGGVGRTTQVNYESGERACDASYLIALERAKVDIVYIITGRGSMEGLSEDEREFVECFRSLADGEQRSLLRVAQSMSGRAKD